MLPSSSTSPAFRLVWLDTREKQGRPTLDRVRNEYRDSLSEYRQGRVEKIATSALYLKHTLVKQRYHLAQMAENMILKHKNMVECVMHIESQLKLNSDMADFYKAHSATLNSEAAKEARDELLDAMKTIKESMSEIDKTLRKLDVQQMVALPEALSAKQELELEQDLADLDAEDEPTPARPPPRHGPKQTPVATAPPQMPRKPPAVPIPEFPGVSKTMTGKKPAARREQAAAPVSLTKVKLAAQ